MRPFHAQSPLLFALVALPFMILAAVATPASAIASQPTPVKTDAPNYPVEAARSRTEGFVEVEFTVGADGKVSNVSVVRAQPSRTFEREAVAAVRRWTFEPATENGQPVEAKVRRRIDFKL